MPEQSGMLPLMTNVPPTPRQVPAGVFEKAAEYARRALATEGERRVQDRLAVFYDVTTKYAGSSFARLEPNDPQDVTAADLFATRLLSVDIGADAARRFLLPGAHRDAVVSALGNVPGDVDLSDADDDLLAAMESLYTAVKRALMDPRAARSNPWVTSSKLCARKRPTLFPVRDRSVCGYLGILHLDDFRLDWQVFRSLVRDREIRAAIDTLPDAVREVADGRDLILDEGRLRLLDAALWTWTDWYGM